jgi:amino acid transporter
MCRCALVVTSVAMTALNYSGLDIVGKSSEVVVVVGIMGVPKMNISNWSKTKPLDEVDWLSFMNIMFWNLNSWDSVSTLAGEVRNPSRLFPRALLLAIQLVRLCLPLVHACVHRA